MMKIYNESQQSKCVVICLIDPSAAPLENSRDRGDAEVESLQQVANVATELYLSH